MFPLVELVETMLELKVVGLVATWELPLLKTLEVKLVIELAIIG